MKSFFILTLLLINFSIYSQSICKDVDEFTGKTTYLYDTRFSELDDVSNPVTMNPYFREIEGKVKFLEIIIKVKGLECIDTGSEVILIFENGEKTSLTNWNKFNCNETMFCSITVKAEELFKTQKLTKFKITNKRNYKSSTVLEVRNQSYFKDIFGYLDVIQNDSSKMELCKKK